MQGAGWRVRGASHVRVGIYFGDDALVLGGMVG